METLKYWLIVSFWTIRCKIKGVCEDCGEKYCMCEEIDRQIEQERELNYLRSTPPEYR